MGKLLEIFDGDRTKAENFIKEVKGYLRLNQDVAGFNSPMKKVHFTLTHMKGPKVANWVKTMGETIESMDPMVDKSLKCGCNFWTHLMPNSRTPPKKKRPEHNLKA